MPGAEASHGSVEPPLEDAALDERRLRGLIEVGRSLVAELDLETVLERLLAMARELTGGRYAALAITAPDGSVERFLFSGVNDETRRQIGKLPEGRGLLGHVMAAGQPVRLADVGSHPSASGFPNGHPSMSSFLGVPIATHGGAYGTLYVTEKPGGEFDDSDEQAATILASWAGIAIENAGVYAESVDHGDRLERAVARLEATSEIARAVGGETRFDRILETVVARAQTLVEARVLVVLLDDRGSLVVAATAGEISPGTHGLRLPVDGAAWRRTMMEGRPERVSDVGGRLELSLAELEVRARTALLVPLTFRDRSLGVLAAFDRIGPDPAFSPEDELLLAGIAANAAMAVATGLSMVEVRLRESIEVAERERARWARELHDETLQGLGALRVRLAASLRMEQPEQAEAIRTAVAQIEDQIANLRALITELRPAALDELGLGAAIEGLVEGHAATTGLDVRLDLDLAHEDATATERLDRELEAGVYRVVQEALTNVAKHASAEHVWVEVTQGGDSVSVAVRDDGVGFDMDARDRGEGFGLVGMRERVALARGNLAIVSTPGKGTELRGRIPLHRKRDT